METRGCYLHQRGKNLNRKDYHQKKQEKIRVKEDNTQGKGGQSAVGKGKWENMIKGEKW